MKAADTPFDFILTYVIVFFKHNAKVLHMTVLCKNKLVFIIKILPKDN
jgi:hypothetical protein